MKESYMLMVGVAIKLKVDEEMNEMSERGAQNWRGDGPQA